ncbi:MAG: beta-propeller fold lactonase family protein [Acidobacteriota bacterium]|nr:beta-propeller fold lactonase family protein [Acidobacteriota bacterium]
MSNRKISAILIFVAIVNLIFTISAVSAQIRLKGVSGTLWVTNKTLNNVVAFEAATGNVLATIPVGVTPTGIIAPRNTGKVYVSNEDSNSVSVISKHTLSVITTINLGAGTKPHHVNASADGRYVFVAEFGTNKIAMIDTATDTFTVLTASTSPTAKTHAIWVSESGRVYAANTVINQIAAIDPFSNMILQEIPVGTNPSEVLITHNERIAYVSVRGENKLKVVDLDTAAIVDEIIVGTQPDTLRLTPDGKTMVVTLRGTPAQIAIVNVFNHLSSQTVNIVPGTTTGHHWLSNNGRYSFVAVERPGGVAVIDNHTAEVVTNYIYPGAQTDSRPHGVFYEPESLNH